jgi:G:T-mismatch repair DNA endonuclease (very short patch repair protein)
MINKNLIKEGEHRSKDTEFKKGNMPWNKNMRLSKRIRKNMSNNYKYHIPFNKGIKGYTNNGSFKKGHKFLKETLEKLEKNRYSKIRGKKLSKEHIDQIIKGHLGKKLSNETKEKIRITYTEKRKTWKTPMKDTSIEVKIQNLLKQLGIEFLTHQYMHIEHGYQCDILIPSMNLVIECFGTYWHSYPISRTIDIIRCNELRKAGYRVLVFWENEIKVMELEDLRNKLIGDIVV